MIYFNHRKSVITLVVVALLSFAFIAFHYDLIPRSLAGRLFSHPTIPVPLAGLTERPMSRELLTLNPPQPPNASVLTSERFVKAEKQKPVKSADGK